MPDVWVTPCHYFHSCGVSETSDIIIACFIIIIIILNCLYKTSVIRTCTEKKNKQTNIGIKPA